MDSEAAGAPGMGDIIRDESGQSTMLIVAVVGLFLMGFIAIGLDVGYLFHEKRMAQAAADSAAVAAAEELSSSNTANEQSVANAMAAANGFDPSASINPATVTLKTPTSGSYSGSASYIEADVSRPIPTFFFGLLNAADKKVAVSARAVAGGGMTSPTCICLEGQTGNDLNMSNNAQIQAPACGITDDSSGSNAVSVVGSASINALSLGTVSSSWNNSGNINNNGTISSSTKIVQGISTQCKPTLTAPTLPSGLPCYSNPINGWTAANGYTGKFTLPLAGETVMSNTVCYNSLDTSQSASITFSPGYTYYIKGDFTTGGGSPITGNGVSFYVGGNINFANGVTSNLTAPTGSDGSPGPLFYVAGSSVSIQGGNNSVFTGIVYAPNAAVNLANGTSTNLTMDFVAQSLTMAGGGALNSYATTNLGTLNLSVAKLAE
ncbi:MAG: pilus assembly protein TadG-related protein [Terracidiphilus sp.]